MLHSLKCYFSATKWKRNTICVEFYSLNFLKPVHVQNVHLLSEYTPNNDVEQRDIRSALLAMEYHWWARKIRWRWISRYQSHEEHCLNDFFGDHVTTCMTSQHFHCQWNFSFFRTDLSRDLAQFHQLQTYLRFLLLLPLLVVVYKIQPSNVVWTSTTFSTFQ